MQFEVVFYLTQPLRDYLFENCDPKDFCTLLCCSWTLYNSFRRDSCDVDGRQLQLSDVFWNKYVCDPTVSETEFCAYLQSLYDVLGYNGQQFTLYHPDWHAPGVQRRVSINLEAWMSIYIKFYDAPWLTAARSAWLDYGFIPINDEPQNSAGQVNRETWIVQQLRQERVFVDGRTRFIGQPMQKFVFWHRVMRFSEPHVQWLESTMKTNLPSLYERYMLQVGFAASVQPPE